MPRRPMRDGRSASLVPKAAFRNAPWLTMSDLELNQSVHILFRTNSNHATNWLSSRSLVVSRASHKAAFGTRLDQPMGFSDSNFVWLVWVSRRV